MIKKVYTMIYTISERGNENMLAKIFENGRSQAVRLPKECRFDGDEVLVNKIGDVVVLMPKDKKWSGLLKSLEMFSDDIFEEGRDQGKNQEREQL